MATDMATGISATTEGILDMVDGMQAGVAASMQGWAQEDTILGVSQSSCTCIVMTCSAASTSKSGHLAMQLCVPRQHMSLTSSKVQLREC